MVSFACREMAIKSIVYLVALLLLLVNHKTRGVQLSEEEEFNLEKRYQLLKQSSVKTIKTEYGGIYDCVDFYKQPAFDHPLLKNHTFHPQMRPSIDPMASNEVTVECTQLQKLQDEGCPEGTVPIKRVSKDDYIKMNSFTRDYASRVKPNSPPVQPGQQFAIVQTNSDPSTTKYYGVQGIFNGYQLSIPEAQYSSGEMIIQNGNDMIKVGWMNNPIINKKNATHLFQYPSASQLHCFNTLCPGFVNTNKDSPIDSELIGGSKRWGTQQEMSLFVFQDPGDKNWWVQWCGITIGFWPQQIFTAMADATYIVVGGEAYAPPDDPLLPMGNGNGRRSSLYSSW